MGKLEPVTVESESTLPKGFLGILTIVVMVCGPSMVGMMLTILIPVLPEIVKHVPGGRSLLIAMPTAGIVVGGVLAGFLLQRMSSRNLMLIAIVLFGVIGSLGLVLEGWPLLILVGLAVNEILIVCTTGVAVETLVRAMPCAP